MLVTSYFLRVPAILNTEIQKRKEGYQDAATAATANAVNQTAASYGVAVLTLLVIYIIFAILVAYGAAKMSWNYNMFVGNPTWKAFLYSLLAFIFSEFYYPMYAYFLDPVPKLVAKGVRNNNAGRSNAVRNNTARNNGSANVVV
jgi:hypothetical protein